MTFLRDIWSDIKSGKDIDVYITVAIALIVSVFSIIGLADQKTILTTVLATLALVSFSLLQNRRDNEAVRDAISQIEALQSNSPVLMPRFPSLSAQEEMISNANQLFLWGMMLERRLPLFRSALEQRIKSNAEVRVLIVKPESNGAKMVASRHKYYYNDEQRVNHSLRQALSDLSTLAEITNYPANFQVRVIDYCPPWSIVSIDLNKPSGKMSVSMVPFRVDNKNRPSMELDPQKDKQWIKFFTDQIENVWQVAEEVDLSAYPDLA